MWTLIMCTHLSVWTQACATWVSVTYNVYMMIPKAQTSHCWLYALLSRISGAASTNNNKKKLKKIKARVSSQNNINLILQAHKQANKYLHKTWYFWLFEIQTSIKSVINDYFYAGTTTEIRLSAPSHRVMFYIHMFLDPLISSYIIVFWH